MISRSGENTSPAYQTEIGGIACSLGSQVL